MDNLYVHVQYGGDWWGEDPLTETVYTNTGDLFRALSGRNKSRRWEALGRCTGKVYVDDPKGKARQVGWAFEARNPEPVGRGETQPTGLRIAYVTVHKAPPTVKTTYHYAEFA